MEQDFTYNMDNWKNLITGLGLKGHDSRMSTYFSFPGVLDDNQLGDMYRTEGLAKKIVDRPVWDSLREGAYVTTGNSDTDRAVMSYMEDLGWKREAGRFLTYDRLYGGALMVVGANDGRKLNEPLNAQALNDIEFFRVYSAASYWTDVEVERDPQNKNFGKPVVYNITPQSGQSYSVHHSRCYLSTGLEIPPTSSQKYQFRGDSVLQACHSAIRNVGVTYAITESILQQFVTGVMKVKNLIGMLASGKGSDIQSRMRILDMVMSTINTVLIDAEGEEYERITSSVQGLPELIDRSVERLSAVSNIPVRILLGKQMGGLNNRGDAETIDYYDMVSSYQESHVSPLLEWMLDKVFSVKGGPTQGKIPEDWDLVFNPVWQLSDEQRADIYSKVAQGDNLYVMNGTLTPQQVAKSRFGSGEYSLNTSIEDDQELLEMEEETE